MIYYFFFYLYTLLFYSIEFFVSYSNSIHNFLLYFISQILNILNSLYSHYFISTLSYLNLSLIDSMMLNFYSSSIILIHHLLISAYIYLNLSILNNLSIFFATQNHLIHAIVYYVFMMV